MTNKPSSPGDNKSQTLAASPRGQEAVEGIANPENGPVERPNSGSKNRSAFGTEMFATLRLAWPLAIANLLQMLVHSIDVMFVARLGEKELAASSLAIAIFGLLLWGLSGLTGATAPLIAAEIGRRKHAVREVRRSVRMGLWLAIGSGLIGMMLCLLGEPFMIAAGQDPEISAMAGSFMTIVIFAMVPSTIANVLRVFVSALDRPIFATFIIATAVPVSVIANWALVFGHLGAPAYGLEGSAMASVVTSFYIMLAYIVVIQRDAYLRRYRIFGNWWRSEWSRMVELGRIGTPIFFTILAEGGLFSGAAFLMGRLSPTELAAHTIALQIAALAFQIPFGVGQAATIRVGYHYGAQNRAAIGRAGGAALLIVTLFSIVTAAIMLIAPHLVLSIFVDVGAPANAALLGFSVQYLLCAALFQWADGVQAVSAGNLRGLQDTRIPMVMACFSYWVLGFGVAIALGLFTDLRGTGVWLGLAIGLSAAACLLTWRWLKRDSLRLSETE